MVKKPPTISFEFFPPKTPEAEIRFWQVVRDLAVYQPDFISVTYGAGGGNREHTARLVCHAQQRFGLTAMAHLTCIGDTQENLDRVLQHYQANGIRHILALRGDRPAQMDAGTFTSSVAFVAYLRQHYPHFRIGVACYPEKHPEARDRDADLAFFLRKVQAGADFAITQFFYDNSAFARFVDDAQRLGSRVPIIPGILPITNFRQIQRFAAICGANIPQRLTERLERFQNDPAAMFEIGVAVAIEQCQALLAQGAPGLHFFALNRADVVQRILNEMASP